MEINELVKRAKQWCEDKHITVAMMVMHTRLDYADDNFDFLILDIYDKVRFKGNMQELEGFLNKQLPEPEGED